MTDDQKFAARVNRVDLASGLWKQRDIGAYNAAALNEVIRLEGALLSVGQTAPPRPFFDTAADEIAAGEVLEAHLAALNTQARLAGIKHSEPAPGVPHGGEGSAKSSSSPGAAQSRQTATDRALEVRKAEAAKKVNGRKMTMPGSSRFGGGAVGLLLAFVMLSCEAIAQDSKAYTLISGDTNAIAATTTNATLYLRTDEFNELALQATARGQSGTPSNLLFHVYRTIDSDTQESAPFSTFALRLSGTDSNTAIAVIDVSGAASVRIVPINTNAVPITNLTLKARFKASKKKITS